MNLCEYKNIFGEAGKGIHSFKFMGVSMVDLLLTVVVAKITTKYNSYTFIENLLAWLISGYVLHRLFCVEGVTYIQSSSS